MPLLDAMVFSIPEAAAITFLVYSLSGVKVRWLKLVAIGILLGSVSHMLRVVIPVYFFYAILYAAILILLLMVFKAAPLWEITISVLLAIPVYLLFEFINVTTLVSVFSVDPAVMEDVSVIKIICFLPQIVATLLISVILRIKKITLFRDDSQEV